MKTSLDWYKHEAGAVDSPKFIALRASVWGWAGEGRFWALNCLIAQAGGEGLDFNRKFLKPIIAKKLDMTADDLDAFLVYLRDECELVHYEDGKVWTERVIEDFGKVEEKRLKERARKVGAEKPLSASRPTAEKPFSAPEKSFSAPEKQQSRVEKSREEESREEKTPLAPPPEYTPEPKTPGRLEAIRDYWNAKAKDDWSLPSCKALPIQWKPEDSSGALRLLGIYSDDEIKKAIDNYSGIGLSDSYERFPVYKTLQGFLAGGVEKFADEARPWETCRKKRVDRPRDGTLADRGDAWDGGKVEEWKAEVEEGLTPDEQAEGERRAEELLRRFERGGIS